MLNINNVFSTKFREEIKVSKRTVEDKINLKTKQKEKQEKHFGEVIFEKVFTA